VFGLNGKNFIKTMLNVGKTHDTVRVVNDQIGTPTYTYDLARLLVDITLPYLPEALLSYSQPDDRFLS